MPSTPKVVEKNEATREAAFPGPPDVRPSAVGACWNSYGTDLDEKKSVAANFALLKPYIKSCHINDLENDAKGTYPYRELFTLLREANYDRYTLIEVGKAYPDVAEGTAYLKSYKALWDKLVKAEK